MEHHRNGDKSDARLENLLVLQADEHTWVDWLLWQWRQGQPLLLQDTIPENLKTCFPATQGVSRACAAGSNASFPAVARRNHRYTMGLSGAPARVSVLL